MAPEPRNMFFRQQNDGPISHNSNNDNDNDNGGKSGLPKGAIIGIAVTAALVVVVLAIAAFLFMRLRSRRRRAPGAYQPGNANGGFSTRQAPITEGHGGDGGGGGGGEEVKGAGDGGGRGRDPYAAANEGLLSNAEAPAIVAWDADHVGSTQDGFAYSGGGRSRSRSGMIQRPASVASFSSMATAPPPRYEEVVAGSAVGGGRRNSDSSDLQPLMLREEQEQGEAEERGRSRSSTSRERRRSGRDGRSGPSVMDGDRRRNVSRFREEGMVDLDMGMGTKP